jgi:hypothetical protein
MLDSPAVGAMPHEIDAIGEVRAAVLTLVPSQRDAASRLMAGCTGSTHVKDGGGTVGSDRVVRVGGTVVPDRAATPRPARDR